MANEIYDTSLFSEVETTTDVVDTVTDDTGTDTISSTIEAEDLDTPIDQDIEDDVEEPTIRKYKVKVDGEELEVDEDELLKGYSRQADFTRKTQAIAAERKQLEELKNTLEVRKSQIETEDNEYLVNKAQLSTISEKVRQADQIDWSSLFRENKDMATEAFAELNQLKAVQSQLTQSLTTREQALEKARQQSFIEELSRAKTELYEKIPEFDNIKNDIVKTAIDSGFTTEELNRITDVRQISMIKEAMLWRKYQESIRNKNPQQSQQAKQSVKPVTGNKGTVTTSFNKDNYLKAFG